MCVDTHISGRPAQTLPLSVRYVLLGFGVSILLGHAEINDMHDWMMCLRRWIEEWEWAELTVGTLGAWTPYEEVIRLNIAVDEVLLVDGLYSGELHGNEARR